MHEMENPGADSENISALCQESGCSGLVETFGRAPVRALEPSTRRGEERM
jgi:hypothetical protein